jgi:hypothetical protein
VALPTAVRDRSPAGTPAAAVLTNPLYPILDVALMLLVLGVLLAYQWSPPPAVWLLGAGVAGFAALDTVFLYEVAPGTPPCTR